MGQFGLPIDPLHDFDQAFREQRNIEHIGAVLLLVRGEQIEKQRPHASLVEGLGHRHVARAETARAAAVRENHQCGGGCWDPEIAGQLKAADNYLAVYVLARVVCGDNWRRHGRTFLEIRVNMAGSAARRFDRNQLQRVEMH